MYRTLTEQEEAEREVELLIANNGYELDWEPDCDWSADDEQALQEHYELEDGWVPLTQYG